MPTQASEATKSPQIDRGLHWRVKDSFVQYVLGGAGGEYAVTGGADDDGEGNFLFPTVSAERARSGWNLSFQGDVRFAGHHGALFVPIVNPIVRWGADGGTLSLQRITAERTPEKDQHRFVIAELDAAEPHLIGDALVWPAVTPRLTAEGVALLGDVYPVGTALDELRMIIDAT